jgi:hypothetical protein
LLYLLNKSAVNNFGLFRWFPSENLQPKALAKYKYPQKISSAPSPDKTTLIPDFFIAFATNT